jgi:hypothetical protein
MIIGEKWVMGGKELQHLFFFRKKSPDYEYSMWVFMKSL